MKKENIRGIDGEYVMIADGTEGKVCTICNDPIIFKIRFIRVRYPQKIFMYYKTKDYIIHSECIAEFLDRNIDNYGEFNHSLGKLYLYDLIKDGFYAGNYSQRKYIQIEMRYIIEKEFYKNLYKNNIVINSSEDLLNEVEKYKYKSFTPDFWSFDRYIRYGEDPKKL